MLRKIAILCVIFLMTFPAFADEQAIELGLVEWMTDHDAAMKKSEETGKPVFLLFQEIPGCATCTTFGREVLSHPLLTEAIETLFVPLVINNAIKPGDADAKERGALMLRYNEPKYNNPVVRFVNAKGEDIIPRKDGVWSAAEVSARMVETLKAAEHEVPQWLTLAAIEADTKQQAEATFTMFCYFTGEAKIGAIDGVVNVRSGYQGKEEAVFVTYHKPTVEFSEIVEKAKEASCANLVYTTSADQKTIAANIVGTKKTMMLEDPEKKKYTSDNHQRVGLNNSTYKWLPLTPAQATKVNAAVKNKIDVETWLTPSQIEMHKSIAKFIRQDSMFLHDMKRPEVIAALPDYEAKLLHKLGAGPQPREKTADEYMQMMARPLLDGKYAEALPICLEAAEKFPETAAFHYNVACVYSQIGEPDKAFAALDKAVDTGWSSVNALFNDKDLAAIRDDPRFEKVIDTVNANRSKNYDAYESAKQIEGVKTVEGQPEDGFRWRVRMSPDATAEKPQKLIVWLHPSDGSFNELVEAMAPSLVKAGYALLVPTQKKFGDWTADDVTMLFGPTLKDAGKTEGIDAESVLIMGYHGGAQAALTIHRKLPKNLDGCIIISGFPIVLTGQSQASVLAAPQGERVDDIPMIVFLNKSNQFSKVWEACEKQWKQAGVPLTVNYVEMPPLSGESKSDWPMNIEQVQVLSDWLEGLTKDEPVPQTVDVDPSLDLNNLVPVN